jgi:hypothetical protein
VHFSAPPGIPRRFRAQVPGAHVLGGHVLGGLVLGAVALVAVVSPLAVLAAPASAATVTAATVIKEAKAAIAAESSAHVEFDAGSTTSSSTEQIVADVGASGGRETVTDGAAVLHVMVTPQNGYISGSASGLTSLFGMTSAEATKVGKRWEVWKKGTTQYKNLESVVSVKSLESLLPKSKGTTLTTKGSDYVLAWTSAASGSTPKLSNTLSVTAKGTTLPVAETSTDGSGEKVTTSISKWGEAVVVHAPAASSVVAASAVTG